MLNQMSLPPLGQFYETIQGCNLRRCFQYLLFFIKSQQKIYSLMPQESLNGVQFEKTPTDVQRASIIKQITKIIVLDFEVGEAGRNTQNKIVEAVILSTQRFIMGLIILGHVHIYEILIREVFPTFIKVIQREIWVEKPKEQILKKITQFCKQTLLLLSTWFPKCFYDEITTSWFKKVVSKYHISVKFFVYYTNDKIDQIEGKIKELRLKQGKNQCLQCAYCLQMSGKNYNALQSIPELPSLLNEDEVEDESSLLKKRQSKFEMKSRQLPLVSQIEENSGFEEQKLNQQNKSEKSNKVGSWVSSQNSDAFHKKESSKLSERIKKHRQQRQKNRNSLLRNSIKSRKEYFDLKSQMTEKSSEKEKKNLDHSTSHSREYNRYQSESQNEEELNSEKQTVTSLNKKLGQVISESRLKSGSRLTYLKYKKKKEDKFKFLDKRPAKDEKLKAESHTEKNLTAFNEDIYELRTKTTAELPVRSTNGLSKKLQTALFLSIFEAELYQTMFKDDQKTFKKETLKLSRKKIENADGIFSVGIRCKPIGKKMQVKIELESESIPVSELEVCLLQPKNSDLLLKKGKQIFMFNFEKGFLPVIFKIEKTQILMPIALNSMLIPLDNETEQEIIDFSDYDKIQESIKFSKTSFKGINSIAKSLKFPNYNRKVKKLEGRFLFFSKLIIICLEQMGESEIIVEIQHKREENERKIRLLMLELTHCLSKVRIRGSK